MISVEMEDVLAVLQLCKPYIIGIIAALALYEGNAKMVSVWANEQAIREIYLKPFEVSVKQGGANAVLDSWSFLGD